MKLRILGDSLRLRLSRSEVETMGGAGRVEDAIQFGPDGPRLVYALVADPGLVEPRATFTAEGITVSLPATLVRSWVETDEVGMSGAHGDLQILVEKDFKCLTPRDGEEAYDGFDNPNASC